MRVVQGCAARFILGADEAPSGGGAYVNRRDYYVTIPPFRYSGLRDWLPEARGLKHCILASLLQTRFGLGMGN